jgi:RNA polymerase sigma-70 factor, ECF subfamily
MEAKATLDIGLLYEEHFPSVFSFALRMLNDEEAARDVVQEAFAAAIESAEKFRGESSVLTWLLAIAKNACYKRLSGSRERSFGDMEAIIDARLAKPSEHTEAERRLYVEEVKNGCLVGLLQCLPFAQRCAFILSILNDLPIDQVGRALGKSPNAVRILLSRSRAAMRAFLCANCSRMRTDAACSCEGMIEFSLRRGLIERYRPVLGEQETLAELQRFTDEVELYKSLPEPEAAIAKALSSGRYAIFENKVK